MTQICLLALIGLPGAGKTGLSNWLLEHQAELSGWNVLHLCYDDYFDLKDMVKNGYNTQRHYIFELLSELIEILRHEDALTKLPTTVRLGATTINNGKYLVICDDNHYYRSMRYKIYQLCRSQSCIYAQIYMATSMETCLLANAARATTAVPEAVILQMHKQLEVPSSETWECNSLTIFHADYNLISKTICDFVKSLMHQQIAAALPLVIAKEPQTQSWAHQLDLLLRARIQTQMQLPSSTHLKHVKGRALNEQRKQILVQFRQDMSSKQTNLNKVQLEYYVNLLN